MASTSSLGAQSTTSTQGAKHFYEGFNTRLRDIKQRIQDAKQVEELHLIFEDVSKARTALTEQTQHLPSYDRQIHEQHLKEVNDLFSEKRALLAPKPKFAFKRKPKVTSTTSTPLTTSVGPPAAAVNDEIVCSSPSAPLSIRDRTGELLDISSVPRSDQATDLHIQNLQDCIVDLRDTIGRPNFLALQLRNLHRCIVLCGSIEGSTMVHDCSDTLLVLQCRQFRMHSSRSMAVLVSTSSVVTIEHCRMIKFAPLYPSQSLSSVQDFDHISSLEPSPNWSIMDKSVYSDLEELLKIQPLPDTNTMLCCAGLRGD